MNYAFYELIEADSLAGAFLRNLLRKIHLDAHLLDLVELCFDPINVVFFILKNRFEQLAGAVIAQLPRPA